MALEVYPHALSYIYFASPSAEPIPKPRCLDLTDHRLCRLTIVCAIERVVNPIENSTIIERVIPIAGDFTLSIGGVLDPKWTRLKTSTLPADRGREGLGLKMGGGRYGDEGEKEQRQKAVVEFLCDKGPEERPRGISRRDDEKNGGENHGNEKIDDGEGGTLSFLSYEDVGDEKVLSLEWHTKYACEGAEESGGKSSGGHWGFFTWFVIM